jgi:hypothetical protein
VIKMTKVSIMSYLIIVHDVYIIVHSNVGKLDTLASTIRCDPREVGAQSRPSPP